MKLSNRRETLILLCGDILSMVAGLFVALFLRYGFSNQGIPIYHIFIIHLTPFSLLFALSITVFFIAGLYEKQTLLFKKRLPSILFNAQLANAITAVLFFYLIPFFGLTPKTNLILYLVVAAALIFVWRVYSGYIIKSRYRNRAAIISSGAELEEIVTEVNNNPRYRIYFSQVIDVSDLSAEDIRSRIEELLYDHELSALVMDTRDEATRRAGNEIFSRIVPPVALIDFETLYEDIYDRVSLSNFNPTKFLEEVYRPSRIIYDVFKRVMDLFLGLVLTVIGVVLYPFMWMLIAVEDRGPFLIRQVRIGEKNKPFFVYKIRTMTDNLSHSSTWVGEGQPRVTRVGRFLRKTSIDEIPQVFNVFRGNMSLIGPRADIEGLAGRMTQEVSFYVLRTLAKPGISGWAQIHQIYKLGNISPQSVEETKLRLAYDLYYLKHRSVMIDLKIALRTITILFSRIRPW
jgi:lipopolysaccharide/colanic/teichoic acid biosynthesis glycosyltransferase